MSITVSRVEINPTGTTLSIQANSQNGFLSKLELWTEETYPVLEEIQDYSQFLNGDSEELIQIPVEILGKNHIYFFNIQDTEGNNTLVATLDFLVFYSKSIDNITLKCKGSYSKEDLEGEVLNSLYIDSLRSSMLVGDYQNSILIFNNLKDSLNL